MRCHPHHRRYAVPVAFAMSLALAACGSGSSSAGSSSPTSSGTTSAGPTVAPPAPTRASGPEDACKLVTSAEAQVALSSPVRLGKAASIGPAGQEGSSCTYESTDFANGTTDGAALTITFFRQGAVSKSKYDDIWRATGGKAVAGLGESAWLFAGILHVYNHGDTLGVGIASLKAEARLNKLTPVARLALGRM